MSTIESNVQYIVMYQSKYVRGMKTASFEFYKHAREYFEEKKADGRQNLSLIVKTTTTEYRTLESQ